MASLAPLFEDLPAALLAAWLIAVLALGLVLGMLAALDDWMNGVPPSGKREPMHPQRMAIPSDVLLGAVAELRCGQARLQVVCD
jgi:hypothetical protein